MLPKLPTGLRYLERSEIHDSEWNGCIEQAETPLPYAYTWYLDIVTDRRWAAVVYGDYAAVMPLPFNRKLFGYRQVYQPILSQQGGIFAKKLSAELMNGLITGVPASFRRVVTNLNAENYQLLTAQPMVTRRTNLCLPLRSPYPELRAGYGKSLRKRLRKAEAQLLFSMGDNDIEALVDLYRKQVGEKLSWPATNYQKATRLIKEAIQRKKGFVATATNQEGHLVARGFFLHDHGRIINLFGASTELGKNVFGMHFLLDRVIHAFSERAEIFDFEGSEIPGVASFFKSFGAEDVHYCTFQRPDRFPWWLKALLEIRK